MAGGNPLAPPGGPPGGPSSGAMPGAPVAGSPPGGRTPQIGRAPFNGAGASFLAPQPPPSPGGNGGALAPPPSQQGQPFADVHQEFKQVNAAFKQNMKAQEVLDHLRTELDQLLEMGDMIRPEDVIESAGRLVGHGIGAAQLAQLMSDMPAQGGQGLASWIRMHDVTVSNAEQQLAIQNKGMQHVLGIQALRSMAATHLDERTKQQPQSGMPLGRQGNSLMGGQDSPMGQIDGGDQNA